jgi:predicted NUDIX family NTP pyrophosphohydrolase
MQKQSAGLLLYRIKNGSLEVFIAHPGGPFWKNKDLGAWSIPKGLLDPGEEPLAAAIREFEEETGTRVSGNFIPLQPVRLRADKIVIAYAVQHDIDPSSVKSNTFKLEYPPRSGKYIDVPEIDRADWFDVPTAREKLHLAQTDFLDQLLEKLLVED